MGWLNSEGPFDLATKETRLDEIEVRMGEADFWNNQDAAQKTIAAMKAIKVVSDPFLKLERECSDLVELLEMSEEEGDAEALGEIEQQIKDLVAAYERFEVKSLLSGPHDAGNAYMSIHAGAGGTESCDWAAMLARMYSRWMEENDYEFKVIESTPGDEAGFRGLTLYVKGPLAYGYLRTEIGVHRLVRISPYDSNKRRHTSFASVDVVPEIDDEIEIEINPDDLRVDTYRSSGAGGQHVNVTDSAVRITHLPTGIVVSCQNERSQHSNRRTAMKVLKARLYRLKEKEREEEMAKLAGEKGDIAWGNQIRSYVLHPYQMVKDHRTDHETSNVDRVLDGDINEFIEAYLRSRLGYRE